MKKAERFVGLMTAILAGAAVGVNTGCATAGSYPGLESDPLTERTIVMRVDNRNWHDVRIYILQPSGARMRVGTVNGLTSAIIKVHNTSPGTARMVLAPIGTRATYTTNEVLIQPGNRLELTVQSSLPQSMLISR